MNRPRSLTYAAVLAVALAAATLLTGAGPSRDPSALPTRGALVPAAFTRLSSPTPLLGYALQVGDVVLVTCPAVLVVDQDVHQVRVACRREPTATPSPQGATATPSPTGSTPSATLTPTASPTVIPSLTSTATPTPRPTATSTPTVPPLTATATSTHDAGGFALGVRLAGDPSVVRFANAHFRSTDFVHMATSGIGLLNSITVAERQIAIGTPADLAAALSAAKSSGIDTVMLNEELPIAQCDQLAADEATVSRQVHAAGLRFVFVPTWFDVTYCMDRYPFAELADGFMLQVQSQQNSPTLAADVHAMNRRLRAKHPGLYVEDQVSVNPPSNRSETAAMVLADIAALEDGSSDAPDAINLFFSGSTDRTSVMEVVIGSLRP